MTDALESGWHRLHSGAPWWLLQDGLADLSAPLQEPIDVAIIGTGITGALIAVGLFTRPAAFIASGTMAAAYFMGHASQGFWPINNGGELAILYCFVFLLLVFTGPGAFSLDAALRNKR